MNLKSVDIGMQIVRSLEMTYIEPILDCVLFVERRAIEIKLIERHFYDIVAYETLTEPLDVTANSKRAILSLKKPIKNRIIMVAKPPYLVYRCIELGVYFQKSLTTSKSVHWLSRY